MHMFEKELVELSTIGARFLVIGAVALGLQGYPRATFDLDIWPDLGPENLDKILRTLKGLGYTPRVPVNPDELKDPQKREEWYQEKHMRVFAFVNAERQEDTVDIMIYHPFSLDERSGKWIVRPHFHVLGFGWVVNTIKISDENGWVIKNKGLRDSLHSTIYYQLSHAGVSDDVHSITWFGSLGYRAKYADRFKVEEDDETEYCDFCGCMLVDFEYCGQGEPPDYEFVGLVDAKDWRALETLEQAVDKKERMRNRFKKEDYNPNPYWNPDAKRACQEADEYIKKLQN